MPQPSNFPQSTKTAETWQYSQGGSTLRHLGICEDRSGSPGVQPNNKGNQWFEIRPDRKTLFGYFWGGYVRGGNLGGG